MKKSLLTICFLSFLTLSAWANSVTVDGATGTTSKYLPVALHTNTSNANYAYHSVSQQLYYASELAGASSTKITAIAFDYVGTTMTDRKIAVWMNSVDYDSFPLPDEENPSAAANETPNMVNPGTKVFSGTVAMVDGASYTITFNTPYVWNGTSNIIVTVLDSTAKKMNSTNYGFGNVIDVKVRIFETSGKVRFLHKTSKDEADYNNKGWDMNNLTAAKANSSAVDNRKYANRITFTFAAAAVPPATPSDLAASNVGSTSASLSWSAVDGATSYKLYHSTTADGVYSELASPATNSYNWSGLTASTTYFVKVAAVNGVGSSALSEPISFTTLAPHIHDGITFEPWSNPSAMPKSGNYYLATDVAYEFYEGGYLDLNGDLNLCLNGHIINLGTKSINVTADHTMTIYDPVGGGKITGLVAGQDGAYTYKGVISVENNGTLVLREGEVENTKPADDPNYKSIAVASGGTLIISGEPVISGNDIDIFLANNNVITIEAGKPLTNTVPYSVASNLLGVITSGWANMSGANPKDYFESASVSKSVCLKDGEAALRTLLNLSENSNNSSISTQYNQTVDVNLTRSLTKDQYNTFCLPFALDDDQLKEFFGAGYDLEEFVSSSLEDDVLSLVFNKVTSLEAGKPYLIQPSVNVTNPSFEGVKITATSPVDQTSDTYISFHGTFKPTELEGGNHNLLFLGAGNELFWPASTGNIKGFRAYFEVKGDARKVAKRARIGKHTDEATAIENQMENGKCENVKMIKDGVLLILRDGKEYNAQGILIR